MPTISKYFLPPTERIPNSHFPLLHYTDVLSDNGKHDPAKAFDLFSRNGWQVQWIFRYGSTQKSHYHSRSHECMAVLTGKATIRFGVADIDADLGENTYGSGREEGGVEIEANAGDVFLIPAGVAHKTYATEPAAEFALLTPGSGKGVDAADPREAIASLQLSGFTMLGAYPNDAEWDFVVGSLDRGDWNHVWSVPKPERDPVMGTSPEGLCTLWLTESVKKF